MALILSTVLFLGVAGLVLLFGYRRYVLAGRVYENLDKLSEPGPAITAGGNAEFFSVRKIAMAVARKLPASAQTASLLQLRLMAAGYRDESAVAVLYGVKILTMAAITIVMLAMELRSTASVQMRLLG